MMERLDLVVARASATLAILGASSTAAIMVIMCSDVFFRATGRGSLPGALELIQTLLVVAIFLCFPYGERSRSHVRIELLTDRLPARRARIARAFGTAVAVVISGWMSYATAISAWESFELREFTTGLVDFPVYPAKACVALGLSLLTVELMLTLRQILGSGPAPAADAPLATTSEVLV